MFELVHSDVWGPTIESFDGSKYFITLIDNFSHVTWVYLLKSKSEFMDVFKDFHMLILNQFFIKIQILHYDNDTKYMSKSMTQYLNFHGVVHQISCVGTSQQNGVAESKNRDLLGKKTCSLMIQMHVPKLVYIINQLPNRVLPFKSPLEVLLGKSIDPSQLKVFGCICFVHKQIPFRDKFDSQAAKCVFLGYSSTKKGYQWYHSDFGKLFVTRDVKFEETTSYYNKSEDVLHDVFPLPISYNIPIHSELIISPNSPDIAIDTCNKPTCPASIDKDTESANTPLNTKGASSDCSQVDSFDCTQGELVTIEHVTLELHDVPHH